MTLPYDLTNASNMSGITDLFVVANQLSNNMFGLVVLVLVFIMVFIQQKNYTSKPAMLAAAFVTSIVAMLLFLIGIISVGVLIASIVITAIAFVINWHE